MLTVHGRRYDTGEPIEVVMRGERILSVRPVWPDGDLESWPIIAPALFDLQINGHGGTWFSDSELTPQQVHRAVQAYLRFGVTRLCPTLITNSFEALAKGFRAIHQACEEDPVTARMVPGCHLEGPYISSEDGPRGAHPRQHVVRADWDEFSRLQDSAGGRIKLVTVAPEQDGVIEFIRTAVTNGLVIAIGHTAATPEQIRAAVDAGATLSTHLGNGCSTMLHRHRNPLWEQLADDRLTSSLIVDGHHLPANIVRTVVKVKTPRNVVLTCDAAGWAGCPPGVYESALGRSEILDNGKLVVAGQRELLAGSALETDVCVVKVREYAGVGWKAAIDMTSRNPARLLGYEAPRLRRHGLADLFLFHHTPGDDRLQVLATIAGGAVTYGSIPMIKTRESSAV
ncbi:MAG TPA: amidohydrolase family protein [Planctomycetaceae bacterium]|nr:amidohydrolase family protein [Planctomycetaceae bacterium]